jgi:hypothetical protein
VTSCDEYGAAPSRLERFVSSGAHRSGGLSRIESRLSGALPRLAVIADVNVEQTGGGPLLLHRMLKGYPADRLMVLFNSSLARNDPALLLPGVRYNAFEFDFPRLIRNRFNPFWPVLQAQYMRAYAKKASRILEPFKPEAVLTVPHWYTWFTASEVAKLLAIPLHLVVHDDWPSYVTQRRPGWGWGLVRWACRHSMRAVYRQAASRLCVSPGMRDSCRRWYGVDGELLYPCRGDDSPVPRVRVRSNPVGPPVVAFCGQIHQDGTVDLLQRLAGVLSDLGGYLDLYCTYNMHELASRGLESPSVRIAGFFPAREMGERIAGTAHALFLPASFEMRERDDVATLFPSKLADYTAIGLPIIVWGPSYSSAVRWASENSGACALVTSPALADVRELIIRLSSDPDEAVRIASAGVEAGCRYFELSAAHDSFYRAISETHANYLGERSIRTNSRSGSPLPPAGA